MSLFKRPQASVISWIPPFCKDLGAVYLASGLSGLFGIVTVPIGVHYLGASGYGILSIYTLVVAYVLLADLGISKNLLRLLAHNRDPATQLSYLRTVLGLYCVLSVLWLVLLPALLILIPRYVFPVPYWALPTLRWLVFCGVAEFIIGVPQSMTQTASLANRRFTAYSRFMVISGILRNSVFVLGAITGSPFLTGTFMVARKLPEFYMAVRVMGALPLATWRPTFSIRECWAMVSASGQLSVAQILYSTVMSVGSYLTNMFFGLAGLGIYRAAFDLAGKVAFVSNGISLVIFPRCAALLSKAVTRSPLVGWAAPALNVSWALYNCIASLGVIFAPAVLPRIGISAPTAVDSFSLLIVGLSLNCHVLMSNDIIQSSGRYRLNIVVSGTALLLICGTFFGMLAAAGPLAIGVAWIVASFGAALVADTIVLRLLCAGKAQLFLGAGAKSAILLTSCLILIWHFNLRNSVLLVAPCFLLLLSLAASLAAFKRAYTALAERGQLPLPTAEAV